MWTDTLQNPEAIKSVFEIAPSLDNVEVMSVTVDRDGPTVTLEMALNEAPTRISPKWERIGANAVSLKIQLLAVANLSLQGWSSENVIKLGIEKEGEIISVSAIGSSMELRCDCGFVRVSGISAYRREIAPIPAT